MIGTYLVHGWMHLFMVQVDYRLFVQVGAWLMHLFMVQVDYRLRYRLMHGMVQIYWYRFTMVYLTVIV
jgi:hypothetical protein